MLFGSFRADSFLKILDVVKLVIRNFFSVFIFFENFVLKNYFIFFLGDRYRSTDIFHSHWINVWIFCDFNNKFTRTAMAQEALCS